MGLLTAALLLGAGSAAMGAIDARKQRKDAEAAMRRNETRAKENAKLVQTKEDPGASIVLGSEGEDDKATTTKKKRPAARPAGKATVGTALSGNTNSIAAAVGLM